MEVVARYHIWCAHALANEDRQFFNIKINNENLEKTMTSIEEIYTNLAHRRTYSPSEAEFRAYMIYLNLNDTIKAMKHMKNVPDHLRKSEPIVRARQILSAFLAENYAVFFRLVRRKATLLEASVLFRYFNQIRLCAVEQIVKSYVPNEKITTAFYTSRLFFNNDQETEDYLAQYGIFPDNEGLFCFKTDRTNLTYPEEPMRQVWQSEEIKSLQGESTPGQIMWGSTLIPWEERGYMPNSSFTGDRLTWSAAQIAQQVEEKLDSRDTEQEEVNQPAYEVALEKSDVLIDETVAEEVTELAQGAIIQERALTKRLEVEGGQVFDDLVQERVKSQ